MAAIADSDDLYAWLIRGFVEAGLPDHTGGGGGAVEQGALDLDNFGDDQGESGVLLHFLCPTGAGESGPDDAYTYQVCVEEGAGGSRVAVRSEDTLFHHAFELPPPAPGADPGVRVALLAAHIVGELRRHNERFTDWRRQGGVASIGLRRGLPPVRGKRADRALLGALRTLRSNNRRVTEGPLNGWWVKAPTPVVVERIEAGLGKEPVYVTPRSGRALSFDEQEHADRLHTAGTVLYVSAGVGLLLAVAASGYAGWSVYGAGFAWLRQGWSALVTVLASGVLGALHGVAGYLLRGRRSPRVVGGLVIVGMLPCVAPCCGVGFPLGAWVLYLLRDERSKAVFAE